MSRYGRIVFLDIDGVIATSSSYKAAREEAKSRGIVSPRSFDLDAKALLVPTLAANVQRLCDLSGAEIVISSTWRELFPWPDLRGWLRDAGITADIVDLTPTIGHRGKEIEQWMLDNDVVPTNIVILEDEEDVAPNRHRQIRTAFDGHRQGFTKRHLKKALQMFGLQAHPRESCLVCGAKVCTAEGCSEHPDGSQISTGEWVCSRKCWEEVLSDES